MSAPKFRVTVFSRLVREALIRAANNLRPELRKAMLRSAIHITGYVKREKLSGQVLHNRTGTLRRSINFDLRESDKVIGAAVGTNVEYAAIHEFGGRTKPHRIEARFARALHFHWQGKEWFRKWVNHPGSVMPERSFLRSALAENQDWIREEVEMATRRALGSRFAP